MMQPQQQPMMQPQQQPMMQPRQQPMMQQQQQPMMQQQQQPIMQQQQPMMQQQQPIMQQQMNGIPVGRPLPAGQIVTIHANAMPAGANMGTPMMGGGVSTFDGPGATSQQPVASPMPIASAPTAPTPVAPTPIMQAPVAMAAAAAAVPIAHAPAAASSVAGPIAESCVIVSYNKLPGQLPMQKRTVYNLQVTGLADGLVSTNGARTYNVRHFYSDFKKLHPRLITLARQFSQRFPPPMPDNGGAEMLLSSQMDSTVRRRQQVFNRILDYMIKTPGVNSDTAVMRFIGIQA
eukprot:g2958.t1